MHPDEHAASPEDPAAGNSHRSVEPSVVMRAATALAAFGLIAALAAPGSLAARCSVRAPAHEGETHLQGAKHASACGLERLASVAISKEAGLGRLEVHGKTAAVLQRDEGVVTLLDVANPARPKVLGRYDDGAVDSLDGDLAFSDDGKWLFYARQTRQFSKDGLHVLDVSDPSQPRLAFYEPGGGMFRVDYFDHGGRAYVVTLDAVDGLVVNLFDPSRAAGAVVPVHVDALPALKVGGPASAGIFIDEKDPILGIPLLYVTTGRTGLQIFDLSRPETPRLLGSWNEVGLAEVEVVTTPKGHRVVFAATEYWFKQSLPPQVVLLWAKDLPEIKEMSRWSLGFAADNLWRVQGMAFAGDRLYVAHSHAGLVALEPARSFLGPRLFRVPRPRIGAVFRNDAAANPSAGVIGAPYSFDVEVAGGRVYLTDASTGTLTVLR